MNNDRLHNPIGQQEMFKVPDGYFDKFQPFAISVSCGCLRLGAGRVDMLTVVVERWSRP